VGITIAVAVLSVGPLIAFGFLLVPPLISRQFARSIEQFALIASGVGGITALAGFYVAYRWDLPVGPTDVALLGALYALSHLIRKAAVRTPLRTRPD
jgi:ABC-type Mn2+/Zn2+ transport system permease subunit